MTVQELQEGHYRQIVESAPTLLWRAGLAGEHDYFNPTWLAFTGRTAEQERGHGWTERVHPDDRERCLDVHRTSFAQRQPFETEYRLCRHDDLHRWMAVHVVPFHVDGELAGFIGSCVDVTELREADEAKATFISMLTNELRKPLMPLLLSSKQLELLAPAGTPEHLVVARRMERQLDRLRALIDRASRGSDSARGVSPQLRLGDVDLASAVVRAIDEHRQRVRARGTQTEILNNGTWGPSRSIRADALEVALVLDILLDNALEYSTDSGTVTVELSFEPTTVRLVIEDDGIGIPQAELARVGTPYFRASNVTTSNGPLGLGVGLAVARDIVGAHGGTLTLSSSAQKGTRATVVLPLSAAGGA
jgi:PAS domain S-box-containing protein